MLFNAWKVLSTIVVFLLFMALVFSVGEMVGQAYSELGRIFTHERNQDWLFVMVIVKTFSITIAIELWRGVCYTMDSWYDEKIQRTAS